MNAMVFKEACLHFAEVAAPYMPIRDAEHYEEALVLIEGLLEEAEDSADDPLNIVIDMLSRAIAVYEQQDAALASFAAQPADESADLALLRVLMSQHQLGVADLPEIGSKSMVSRVLSGQRSLSKQHIKALANRFGINPGLFF